MKPDAMYDATSAPDYALELPVPHIHDDGSVTELRVTRLKYHHHFAIHNDNTLIVVGSADHARTLARALVIAANQLDRDPKN